MTHPLDEVIATLGHGPIGEPATVDRPRYVRVPPYRPSGEELRAMVARRIPKRFQWARWDSPDLARRVKGGAAMVARAQTALARRRRVVFVGASGAGKTALVCAWLAERILAGAHRAAFVPDRVLLDTGTNRDGVARDWYAMALTASPLVLDNFGSLYGAPRGSGLAAQRIMAVSRLVQERHDLGLGCVVTTDKTEAVVTENYGDDIARRIFGDAAVIEFGR
jgi:hypothetical protein